MKSLKNKAELSNPKVYFIEKSDDKLQAAKMARRISRLIARKPEVLNARPEWSKYKDSEEKMQDAANETRKRHREEKPGPVHDLDDEETEKGGKYAGKLKALLERRGESASVFDDLPIMKVLRDLENKIQKAERKEVSSIAVISGDKILMGKRTDNQRYTIPGGHLNPGEDPKIGVLRELKEEAGLVVPADRVKHLGSKNITSFTGKKMKIHAYEVKVDDNVKPHSKNDPDKEVKKWEWVVTKDGLPKEVLENLHSPKNVVLQKMGLQKGFIIDLLKGKPHKYLRKYQRGGKWIYIYHEGENRGKRLDERGIQKIHQLAELGDEHARGLVESTEEHSEEKLKILRKLADHGDEAAKKHLHHMGIDREQERLEEATGAHRPQDKLHDNMDTETKTKAHNAIKNALEQNLFGYLRGHATSPYSTSMAGHNINLESVMSEVKDHRTVADMLTALHDEMNQIDAAHHGLPVTQNGSAREAGGYGNLAYNKAITALETAGVVPEGYGAVHRRAGRNAPELVPFKKVEERREQEKRQREERERIELGELHGSMAHSLNQYMVTPLSTSEVRRLHQVFKTMFNKNLKAEDWPYDFSSSGYKVKISRCSIGSSSVDFSFNVTDREGKVVTNNWSRSWSTGRSGAPHIYNAGLVIKSEARGTDKPLGWLINQAQAKLMKTHTRNGDIGVTAALDVGGYNWANQGFEFESSSSLSDKRSDFKTFAARHGVTLSEADMQHFKAPCHFAAFHDGKLYEHSTSSPIGLSPKQIEKGEVAPGIPLTPEEISSKKTTRLYVHLGKKFLLGNSFSGILKVQNMNNDNEAWRYSQQYQQMKLKSWEALNEGYKAVVKRAGGDKPTTIAGPRNQARVERTTSPTTPSNSNVSSYLRYWRPSGRAGRSNITLTARRLRTIGRWASGDIQKFLQVAPLTADGKRRVREVLASVTRS